MEPSVPRSASRPRTCSAPTRSVTLVPIPRARASHASRRPANPPSRQAARRALRTGVRSSRKADRLDLPPGRVGEIDRVRQIGGRPSEIEAKTDHDPGHRTLPVVRTLEKNAGELATIEEDVVRPFEPQSRRIADMGIQRLGHGQACDQGQGRGEGQGARGAEEEGGVEIALRRHPVAPEAATPVRLDVRADDEARSGSAGRALANEVVRAADLAVALQTKSVAELAGDHARLRKGAPT